MQHLCQDIIFLICSYCIKNRDIVHLLSITEIFHTLKHNYVFDKELIPCERVKSLSYKNNIKNILIKHIDAIDQFLTITRLVIGDNFNQVIKKGILPSTLKDLTFGTFLIRILK